MLSTALKELLDLSSDPDGAGLLDALSPAGAAAVFSAYAGDVPATADDATTGTLLFTTPVPLSLLYTADTAAPYLQGTAMASASASGTVTHTRLCAASNSAVCVQGGSSGVAGKTITAGDSMQALVSAEVYVTESAAGYGASYGVSYG